MIFIFRYIQVLNMCDFHAFAPACWFSFLFSCMLFFLHFCMHDDFPSFSFACFFSFFIFLYDVKCTFTMHSNPECSFTAHFDPSFSSFLYYCAYPQHLGCFSKLHPKFLSNIYISHHSREHASESPYSPIVNFLLV
jgi:hypothetical protein